MTSRVIEFQFKGDPRDLDRAMGQIRGGADKTGAAVEDAADAGSSGFGMMSAAAGAATVAIGSLVADIVHGLGKKAIDSIKNASTSVIRLTSDMNNLAKEAKEISVDVDELDLLQGALDELTKGGFRAARVVQDFQRNMADVADGAGEAASEFAKLGISVDDVIDLPLREQMIAVADGFENLKSAADRSQVAMSLFGRAGRSLAPALAKGSEALGASIERARESSTVTAELALKSEALQDAILHNSRTFIALRGQALEPLIPIVTAVVLKVTELTNAFLDTGIPQAFGRAVAFVAEKMLGLTSEVKEFREEVAKAGEGQESATEQYNRAFESVGELEQALVDLSAEQERQQGVVDAATKGIGSLAVAQEGLADIEDRRKQVQSDLRLATSELSTGESRLTTELLAGATAASEAGREEARLAFLRKQFADDAAADAGKVGDAVKMEGERVATLEEVNGQRRAQLRAIAIDRMINEEQRLADALATNSDRSVFLEQQSAERRSAIHATSNDQQLSGAQGLFSALASLSNTLLDAEVQNAEAGSAEREKLAKRQFNIQKGVAVAQAGVNALLAASNAFASAGNPVIGAILAGISLATGLAQVAAIVASPPPQGLHRGGMVASMHSGGLSRDEAIIRVREREGVLSQQGVAAAGGPAGVAGLNRGEGGGGGVQTVVVVSKTNNRTTDVQTHEALRRVDSPLSSAIRSLQPQPVGSARVW